MRFMLATLLWCSSSAALGQNLNFTQQLRNDESEAVKRLLDGEPGFNINVINVARLSLNDDDVPDLVILFKSPATCAVHRCEAHVLLSYLWPGGAGNVYQDAYANAVRRIELGPIGKVGER